MKNLIPKMPVGCRKFTEDELKRKQRQDTIEFIDFHGNGLDTLEDWIFELAKIQKEFYKSGRPGILQVGFDGPAYEGYDRMEIYVIVHETDDEYTKRLAKIVKQRKTGLKQKRKRRLEKKKAMDHA